MLKKLNDDVKEVYYKHWNAVKTHKRPGMVQSVYTMFWDPHTDSPDWDQKLLDMFHEQNKRFKINFSHSFLLKHKEKGDLSFFHASQNNHAVLERPRLISSKQDFLSFLREIGDHDVLGQVQRERPDSRYSVVNIMSTSFYVYPLHDYPIGCGSVDIPSFLLNNVFIHTLHKDEHHGFVYSDGLCLFRCLALHQGASRHCLQKPTKALFKRWSGHSPPSDFAGVTLSELESVENVFQMNIDVFQFDETQSPPVLVPLRRSAYHHADTLRVLHYQQHFMHIIDIDKLGHALACSKCSKLFKDHFNWQRHETTCIGGDWVSSN